MHIVCCTVQHVNMHVLYTGIPSGSAACKLTVRRRDQLPNHQRLRSDQEEASTHSGGDGKLMHDPEIDECMKRYEEERKLRTDFDSVGLSKTLLRSKKRTPLENKALLNILKDEETKRKEREKLRQMVRLFGACNC